MPTPSTIVKKKIIALQDLELNTSVALYYLSTGEVAQVLFKNERQFENLLAKGSFKKAPPLSKLGRNNSIPVVIDEHIVETVDNVDLSVELTGNLDLLYTDREA